MDGQVSCPTLIKIERQIGKYYQSPDAEIMEQLSRLIIWKKMGFDIIFFLQGNLSFQMVKKTVCLKLFSAVLDSSLSRKD